MKTWIASLPIHVIADSAEGAAWLVGDRLQEGEAVISQPDGHAVAPSTMLYLAYINPSEIDASSFTEGHVIGPDWNSGQDVFVAYVTVNGASVVSGWWATAQQLAEAIEARNGKVDRVETINVPYPIEDSRSIGAYLNRLNEQANS
jgi:hypothetical protein